MSTGEPNTSDVLETLQHKGDNFARSIIVERKRLNDLVDAIRHIDEQTDKYRESAKKAAIQVMNLNILTPNPAYSKADGAEIGKQAQAVTTKTMVVLEAKLNSKSKVKSEKQQQNNQLKVEIDHMRRMRLQTDLSHRNFDAQLRALREKITFIMSESTAVVEQREGLVDSIQTLERHNAEEQKQFEAEFDEMGRYIQEQNTNLELALVQERKENLKDDVDKGKTSGRDDSHSGQGRAAEQLCGQ
jgi:chromosome segregation ATPase